MNDNNWIYKSHYKNAYIITIYELKTAFNDFKEEFVNRIREKKKKKNKDSQKGNNFLGIGSVMGG